MARHRRLQKKNRKKLKSVDPFNYGKNSIRETKAHSKTNIAPTVEELDAQPMSRSSRDLAEHIASSSKKTFPAKSKKRPRNRLTEETEKAGFVRRRYENETQFMRRVGNLTHHMVQEEFMKVKYELAGRDVKEIAADFKELDEKAKRRKAQKMARREKFIQAAARQREQEEGEQQRFQQEAVGVNVEDDVEKKAKKQRISLKDRQRQLKREHNEDDAADLMLNAREVIAFGERTDAPPEFTKQCKFTPNNRIGERKLLLKSLLEPKSNGIVAEDKSSPKAKESERSKKDNEEQRLQVIEAYRQLKRQKRNLATN